VGVASWYGPGFHGQSTASGEIYNQNALTAAHRTLPLGTRVEVTNLSNGKSVQVRINDRGPYVRGRSIDLSRGAARKLGMVKSGVSKVRIKPLSAHGSRKSKAAISRPQKKTTKRTQRVRRPPSQGTSLKSMLATIWPF
jgi:rare lipoprotein A